MISNKRNILLLTAVILVVAGVAYYFLRPDNKVLPGNAKTTSKQKTAQADYSSGDKRNVSSDNSLSQGGAVDQQGKAPDPGTSPSEWVSSDGGAITLKQPTNGSVLKTGDIISGTSNLGSVQYRLVDDSNGVIAQGQLSVVNGVFSGKLQFKSYGPTGTLKLFSFNSDNSSEINRLQVNVKFNP